MSDHLSQFETLLLDSFLKDDLLRSSCILRMNVASLVCELERDYSLQQTCGKLKPYHCVSDADSRIDSYNLKVSTLSMIVQDVKDTKLTENCLVLDHLARVASWLLHKVKDVKLSSLAT